MATIAPRRQEDAGTKKTAVNFSRLRRDTGGSSDYSAEKEVVIQEQSKDSTKPSDLRQPDLEELIQVAYNDDRNVRSIQAFYTSNEGRPLPDEPRFPTDTLNTIASVAELQDTSRHDSLARPDEPVFFNDGSPTSNPMSELPDTSRDVRIETGSISELPDSSPSTPSSASTQLLRDDRSGTPTQAPAPKPAPTVLAKSILRKIPTRTNTSTSSDTISRPSSSSSAGQPLKSILKHTTVEQYSEAAYSEAGEDEGSHHTVSENGTPRIGSVDSSGKWSSSDYDTSQLSEKELKKLEKKGINPALYLEMKAARGAGGKKRFGGLGSLTGNAYVS
ncbi:hypothetical protein DOTSEDRAFT_72180 [Dothistroma septosporum NZE10]|uniref:Uncharacterized protein n=1 Tax=Dothistroma septosporum (strain NZE10 / CBS 128990) TaxID=675120 RepID=N1PMK5_DOTSN|nr:hypothetical protein DOTSEDRAFT_72180 [Dothistroma septosporum NZE10]